MTATHVLARYRVALGGVMAAFTAWLARPTPRSLLLGVGLIAAGVALRIWAAGHVEKSREVTSSGPYRFTRHPLYLGSTLLGIGFAVAANHLLLGVAVVAYLAATLGAAIRAEEAHLREKFGAAYDAYAAGTPRFVPRLHAPRRAAVRASDGDVEPRTRAAAPRRS